MGALSRKNSCLKPITRHIGEIAACKKLRGALSYGMGEHERWAWAPELWREASDPKELRGG